MKGLDHNLVICPSKTLVGVHREWHTRKPGAYIVWDRHGQYIIVSQRLTLIAKFLNSMATDSAEKVSVSALHQIVGRNENRVCGYTKNRWKLSFCKLEETGSHFECARGAFEQALILGAPDAYQLAKKKEIRNVEGLI